MDKEDLARIKSMSDELEHIYEKYADADFQTADQATKPKPKKQKQDKTPVDIAEIRKGDEKIYLENVEVWSIENDTF
ncbi:MAG: hypothetical protein R6V83_07205, partial [Candidatus Thorarchaeota archaeon]